MPIGSVCSVYIEPVTSTRYLLILHEALIFMDMKGTLLDPNQMCCNGLIVNDTPVQFNPDSDLCIHAKSEEGDAVCIPLSMEGIMSGFLSS